VLSPDEMTGIQALARQHPPSPMGPGRVARRECAYRRRGTWTLLAHGAVAQGTSGGPSWGPTRTAEDFCAPLTRTVASEPEGTRWPLVPDHLHLHPSASVGRFVAKHDGIEDDRGHKEPRGMLKALATRAAFLAEPTQRIVLH
jgi:hypothetical protein